MSFETWSTDGYGLKTSDIKIRNVESVWNLIDMDEKFSRETRGYFAEIEEPVENVSVEDIIEFTGEDGYRPGIAGILSVVIEDLEDVSLAPLTDCYNDEFLMLLPHYSWDNISNKERNISKDELRAILKKYVSVVSDTDVDPDYWSAEDFG